LLLSRERAKFSRLWRKVKIAAGIAKAMSRTQFGLTTPQEEIAAVRNKNEFLEVPLILTSAISYCDLLLIMVSETTKSSENSINRKRVNYYNHQRCPSLKWPLRHFVLKNGMHFRERY